MFDFTSTGFKRSLSETNPIQRIEPDRAAYSGQVELKENDIVTFAVGYGKNKTHFKDTTGHFAHVTLLLPSGRK